jgi:hypothetical protein
MKRQQVLLAPKVLDASIEGNTPVRFVDADAERLDLAALWFTHALAKETECPADTPGDRLKQYMMEIPRSFVRVENERKTPPALSR